MWEERGQLPLVFPGSANKYLVGMAGSYQEPKRMISPGKPAVRMEIP